MNLYADFITRKRKKSLSQKAKSHEEPVITSTAVYGNEALV